MELALMTLKTSIFFILNSVTLNSRVTAWNILIHTTKRQPIIPQNGTQQYHKTAIQYIKTVLNYRVHPDGTFFDNTPIVAFQLIVFK